jgi:hypothetical protein
MLSRCEAVGSFTARQSAATILALVQVKCKVVLPSLLPPFLLLDKILKTLREKERERARESERERAEIVVYS